MAAASNRPYYNSLTERYGHPLLKVNATSATIQLIPNSSRLDERTINLTADRPVTIGRASKSKTEYLQAGKNNALFDCPVISRLHARLDVDGSRPKGEEVTIVDLDSMHGTFVDGDKLVPGRPYTLKIGSKIQVGDRVVRGNETHSGIILEYNRLTDTALSQTQRASGTYAVPFISDDESDVASDTGSGPQKEAESATTTPEQAKAVLGSQEAPIDLDNTTVEVIDLDVDEETSNVKKTQTSGKRNWSSLFSQATKAVFPNPIVIDDPIAVPAAKPARTAVKDTYDDESDSGSSDSDDESEAAIEIRLNKHGEDLSDNVDVLSASDASDLGHDEEPMDMSDESSDEDEEGPEVMSSNRQLSPELGEPKASGFQGFNSKVGAQSSSQPSVQSSSRSHASQRYDPVRGLNQPLPLQPFPSSAYYTAPSQPQPATSRWDVQPTNMTCGGYYGGSVAPASGFAQSGHYGEYPPPSKYTAEDTIGWDSQPYGSYSGYGVPPFQTSFAQYDPDRHFARAGASESAETIWRRARDNALKDAAPVKNVPTPQDIDGSTADYMEAVAKKAGSACEKQMALYRARSKMPISALVDEQPALKYHVQSAPKSTVKTADAMEAGPSTSKVTGFKRKAEEISDDEAAFETLEEAEINEAPVSLDATEVNETQEHMYAPPMPGVPRVQEPAVVGPASKKVKMATTCGVAAAAAFVGSASTVAFLASPLAQRVLDWLA